MAEQPQIDSNKVMEKFLTRSREFSKQLAGVGVDHLFTIAQLETLVESLQDQVKSLQTQVEELGSPKQKTVPHTLVED